MTTLLTPGQIKPKSFESRQNFFFFWTSAMVWPAGWKCWATGLLRLSFLSSSLIIFCPSSDTRRRPRVESAGVVNFLYVSSYRWVHFSGAVLFCQPHQQLVTHSKQISRSYIYIYNFCIALYSGVPKLTALYNILQHFLSFTNIIPIIMTTNNV